MKKITYVNTRDTLYLLNIIFKPNTMHTQTQINYVQTLLQDMFIAACSTIMITIAIK